MTRYASGTKGDATERQVHLGVARYLNLRRAVWFHTPNGGSRNVIEAARFKSLGVRPGIPDIVILAPCLCALELKRERRSSTTDAQKAWLQAFADAGFKVAVARGIDDALAKLKEWGI
jgi:hypothetical protein